MTLIGYCTSSTARHRISGTSGFVRNFGFLGFCREGGRLVGSFLQSLWSDERGQDIAEYAVMLAVVLVIVIGTVRLIGSNANNVFSEVASSIQ
jgi:Flp pilus assembly pilin Flp